MADFIVHAGTDLNFGLYSNGNNRAVFQNPRSSSNNVYYVVYINDNGDLVIERSSNGITWSLTPELIYAGTVTHFDVKIHDTGSALDIFIVLTDSVVEDLTYCKGTVADSDTSTDAVSFSSQDIDAALVSEIDSNFACAIARNDNGYLVVAFTEDWKDMGKAYRRTIIIGSDGDGASPNWSDETIIDEPAGSTNNQNKVSIYMGMESFSSSYPNRVFIYARIPEATTLSTYIAKTWAYDWNGSSFSSVDSDTPDATGSTNFNLISGIIDDSDYIHFVVRRGTAALSSYKGDAAGSAANLIGWTQITDLNVNSLTLTLDRTNDELYAFYHHIGDSTTYHYKKTDVGTISWGSEEDITSTAEVSVLSSWNSDIEGHLHLAYVNIGGDIYYDSLAIGPSETTAYKDITLKTSLESALTYKDITLKTTLDSLDYKDITLKISFSAAPLLGYKDITLKTSLESALTYKDITLKTTLESALTYKDVTLKTTLESALTLKDVVIKTTLESIPIYKDISLKISLTEFVYIDYKDITLKTTLESALTYKDITLKTTLESIPIYKDITLKTSFLLKNFKDVAIKTSFELGDVLAYKDITLKITLESALTYKDVTLKTTIESALIYKDIVLKTSLESALTYKDITLKTTLESAITYKDITLKTTLDLLAYKDITLKTTLESIPIYKDITLKSSLESALTYKDITLKTTLDLLAYKDIVLKTSLESALTYKDISLKTSFRLLQIIGYKDIALKISFIHGGFNDISIRVSLEAIVKEIINFTSSITQTEQITSSINQIEEIISSITQTENFIANINT